MFFRFWPSIFRESRQGAPLFYFKAENLVLRARSDSVGFAEIVNKDRMFGTKAQSKNQKTLLNNKLK